MLSFREALQPDLDAIILMLCDDALGTSREIYQYPLPEGYVKAFQAISSDPNIELIVACENDDIVGVAQVTFTPHLTYQGGWRATIEGVRTDASRRGKGVGSQLIQHIIGRAGERKCHLVQLTTDKRRPDALRFYEHLGFTPSHEGLKLHL